MDNLNTKEYLEKTKNIIIQNLKNLAHAPSVQMQNIPADGYDDLREREMEAEEDARLETRITDNMKDKSKMTVEEFSDSEDEDGDDRRNQEDNSANMEVD
jgi:histone deacetylase 1/2